MTDTNQDEVKQNNRVRRDCNKYSSDDFRTNKITETINKIYNISNLLQDLSRSILITMAKEQDANECELH